MEAGSDPSISLPRSDTAPATIHWHPPWAVRFSLSLAAIAAAAVVYLALWSLLRHMAPTLVWPPNDLRTFFPWGPLLIMVPLLAGLFTYHSGRLWLLMRGWRRYFDALAQDLTARVAQRAPLVALGYTPQARSRGVDALATPQHEPVAQSMDSFPRLLLIGDDGAGKTTALVLRALEIARGANVRRILFGRQMVPLLVSLPRYLQAPSDPLGLRLGFLTTLVHRYGATLLARQLPTLLRRGRVVLCFDGLDEISYDQAADFLRELNGAMRQTYRNVRIVLACRTATASTLVEDLPLLRHLPQAQLLPLQPEEMQQIIRRAGRVGSLGTTAAEGVLQAINEHELVPTCCSPALLAMVIELVGAGQPVPASRLEILHAYESLLLRRNAISTDRTAQIQHVLGEIAVALRLAGMTEITGAQPGNEEEAVRALLADTSVAAGALGGNSRPLVRPREALLANTVELAIEAGVLERGQQGGGLRFRHSLLLYLAAARLLDEQDAGLGRVSPTLLRPEWIEILILWGGLTRDPAGLAERLSRFATTPAGVAAVARLGSLERVEVLALALALTVGVASLVPRVTNPNETNLRAIENDQHNLRDLFEHILQYSVDEQQEDRRMRLRAALLNCESGTAGELTPLLARLVRSPTVNRLLRAQAVQVLGLLASPASLEALTALLLEPEPVVREALSRGFHLAGSAAVEPLLDLVIHNPSGSTIHRRAVDALAAVDGPAVPAAIARLKAPQPAVRAAAAEVLGALRDRRAIDPLLAVVADSDLIAQLAAIRALGRLGDLKAQGVLLPLLQSGSEEQRMAAAEALGLLRSDRAIKPLITLLEDRQPRLRAAAAEALGHIGDARAVEPLRQHLGDRDAWAQAAAATALRALGKRA